jgi:Right handed beta helix region
VRLALLLGLVAVTPFLQGQQVTTCPTSLQSLVDAATAGSVLSVPPCLYRETVTVRQPITLDGQGQAEIRGSNVWTAWTQNAAGLWVSTNNVPQLGDERPYLSDGRCGPSGTPTLGCVYREQVYLDAQPLQLIAPNSTPAPGQFALDSARHVVLADDPTGRTVEVTVRTRWLRIASNGVTVRGFVMRHAASPLQQGGLSNDGYDDFTIADSTLMQSHDAPVMLIGGHNAQVLRNDISSGGAFGIAGGQTVGALVQRNTIHDNGTATNPGWGAGGLKLGGALNAMIDDNEVMRNPFGVWCDVHCAGFVATHNRVHDNPQGGIQYEISTDGVIRGNAVWGNGFGRANWGWGAGILVQSSGQTEVDHNTVAWNYAGISDIILSRPDKPADQSGVQIHDNLVARQIVPSGGFWTNQLLFANDDQGGKLTVAAAPSFAANLVWADQPEASVFPVRFTYANVAWPRLASFMSKTADTASRYMSDAEAFDALQTAGTPTGPIPAPPTSTPTATPTATDTPTPTPTATATPTPACYVLVQRGLTATPYPVQRADSDCQ